MKKLLLIFAAAFMLLPVWGGTAKKALVVYFTWSDAANTDKVAAMIAKAAGADTERLVPVKAYPRGFKEILARGKAEIQGNENCPIKKLSKDLKKYDTVFVGTPIWFGTYSSPVRTFLKENDLKGKKVYFFCTHGKGGAGRFFNEGTKLVPGAVVGKGFSCCGDTAGTVEAQVQKWIKENVK